MIAYITAYMIIFTHLLAECLILVDLNEISIRMFLAVTEKEKKRDRQREEERRSIIESLILMLIVILSRL